MFSFQQILNSSPEVKEYFSLYANSNNQCIRLATELIKQSIVRRKIDNNNNNNNNKFIKKDKTTPIQQQPHSPTHNNNKQSRHTNHHYNVAYIKHNRFLSPSQKKQITPKVTQIIPISPQKVFIYGKPKVKLQQFNGCQIHHQNQCQDNDMNGNYQQYQEENYNGNVEVKGGEKYHNEERTINSSGLLQEQHHKQNMQVPYQYEEYLLPKNKNKNKNKSNNNNLKQQQTTQNQPKNINNNKTIGSITSPKNSKQTYNNTSNNNRQFTSPKSHITINQQNYNNVQSKIKQFIIRDKRTRQVQKQVQKQKQKIQQLQQRQNMLLLQQRQQEKEIRRQQMLNNERQRDAQLWRIKQAYQTTYNNQMAYHNNKSNLNNYIYQQQLYQHSSPTTQSQDSIVNLHNHKLQQSRVECYQCEIQRLRKRKQKAKQAIRQIEKQQAKRSKLLIEIAQNSQLYPQISIMKKYPNNLLNCYDDVDASYVNGMPIY